MNIYKIIMSHPIGAEPWKSQPRQTKVGKPRQETQKKKHSYQHFWLEKNGKMDNLVSWAVFGVYVFELWSRVG